MFNLRASMLGRRINFIQGEVARVDPDCREVMIAGGDLHGSIGYDYLVFALGRRLATERVTGFFEHAHHLLDLDGAFRFGEAIRNFKGGRAVIGQCPDARLPVPVYESVFALARLLEERGEREQTTITIVSPDQPGSEFDDPNLESILTRARLKNGIESLPGFQIARITGDSVLGDHHELNYDLLMLLPPFCGSSVAARLGLGGEDGYLNVDWNMKVLGVERMYAVGDCVNLSGPKLGHLAVRQAEVAATNLAAEIAGRPPAVHYQHDLTTVIDADGNGIYFHKDLCTDEPSTVHQGRFWGWAKRIHEKHWQATHQ
jgi:sulfide:quinone oxidoreductase